MKKSTRLTIALCLSFVFMCIEVVGGLWSNSLAVLSDAAHMFTDVAGFAVALAATIVSEMPGSENYTFGLIRAEVMGALGSIMLLWLVTILLVYNAYLRLNSWFAGEAVPVDGFIMFVVACFGVAVNIILGSVFMEDHAGLGHDHSHGHGGGHDGHDSHGHNCAHDHEEAGIAKSRVGGHEHDHAHSDECMRLVSASKALDHGHDHDHGSMEHIHGGNCDHGHSGHEHADHGHSEDHGHSAELEPFSLGDPLSASAPSDVNIQAAYLHVITDTIQSIAVALAGAVIWAKPDWQFVDPIATFLFSGLVLYTTVPLMDRVFKIMMEGVPAHINWTEIKSKFLAINGVQSVNHLHIWSLSSTSVSLSCHIKARDPQAALRSALKVCQESGIDHPTIQVEDFEFDSRTQQRGTSTTMSNFTCVS